MTQNFAFFDVDGTLIRDKSMVSFLSLWYQRSPPLGHRDSSTPQADLASVMRDLGAQGASRELMNRRYYQQFEGFSVEAVASVAQSWAESVLIRPGFFIQEVIQQLNALRSDGIEPVLVSGSFVQLLQPLAEHLGIDFVLATRLIHNGKVFDGQFMEPQMIGAGKATAVRDFLGQRGVATDHCWAFGDDISDLQMLEAVGNPVAVVGDQRLRGIAASRGWTCLYIPEFKGTVPSDAQLHA